MKIVGITTPQEAFVGSRDRNFRMNEFLIVEDQSQGDLIAQVVEAKTYNRYIPLNIGGDFVDSSVIESLKAMGYDVSNETIYIAKIRLLKEALYPILTGSKLREPKFREVKNLLVSTSMNNGFSIGVIKNTDTVFNDMDEELKDIVDIYEDGKFLNQKDVPFIMDYRAMSEYPHIGIFGGSGSGKSFGIRVILEEVMKKKIPTVVLDPHYEMTFSNPSLSKFKKDYSGNFVAVQIGKDVGIKFEDITKYDLKNLLSSVSNLTDSMENIVDVLFTRGNNYYSFHNKLEYLLEGKEIGSEEKINEKIFYADSESDKKKYEEVKKIYIQYDKKTNDASIRGILWRLERLEKEGIFNKDIRVIEKNLQSSKLVVVQGSNRLIQIFSTYLLSKLYYQRRSYRDSISTGSDGKYFPPFIIVTDESHNFAPKSESTPTKSILREVAQEGRKYGVFLILATQRPTLLDETITAQLNTKFIFRTVRASDIDTIREETDISTEDAKRLPYLSTGDVFISSAKFGRTFYVRIRASSTNTPHKDNPFDELEVIKEKENEEFFEIIKNYLPIAVSTDLLSIAKDVEINHKKIYDIDEFKLKLKTLLDSEKIICEKTFLGKVYKLK